jgi:hypothetical protein
VTTAAESLASRFGERVGAIRSWDQAVSYTYSYTDMESDFLVIDRMCSQSPPLPFPTPSNKIYKIAKLTTQPSKPPTTA